MDGPGEEQYLAVPVLLSNVRKCFENLDGRVQEIGRVAKI